MSEPRWLLLDPESAAMVRKLVNQTGRQVSYLPPAAVLGVLRTAEEMYGRCFIPLGIELNQLTLHAFSDWDIVQAVMRIRLMSSNRKALIRKAMDQLSHPSVRAAQDAIRNPDVSEARPTLDWETMVPADASAHEKALAHSEALFAAYDAEPFLTADVIRDATDPDLIEYLRLVEETFGSLRMPDGLNWSSALREVQVALTRPGSWVGVDYVDGGAVVKALGINGLSAVTADAVIPALEAMRPAFEVLVHCLITAHPRDSKYVAALSMCHQSLKTRASKPGLFINPSSAAAVKDRWPVGNPQAFMKVFEATRNPAVGEALETLGRVLDELMKSGECLRRGAIEWEDVGRVIESLLGALREARDAVSDFGLIKASEIAARYTSARQREALPLLDTVGRLRAGC